MTTNQQRAANIIHLTISDLSTHDAEDVAQALAAAGLLKVNADLTNVKGYIVDMDDGEELPEGHVEILFSAHEDDLPEGAGMTMTADITIKENHHDH